MILPPKRYEICSDPKYDSIRHFDWFARLEQRRGKINLLREAYLFVKSGSYTQQSAADVWQVDVRELRDYINFVERKPANISKSQQHCLDACYTDYCAGKGEYPFRESIYKISRMYGFNPRHIIELWETAPNFYPNEYKKD